MISGRSKSVILYEWVAPSRKTVLWMEDGQWVAQAWSPTFAKGSCSAVTSTGLKAQDVTCAAL